MIKENRCTTRIETAQIKRGLFFMNKIIVLQPNLILIRIMKTLEHRVFSYPYNANDTTTRIVY